MPPTSTRDLTDSRALERRVCLTDFNCDASEEAGCQARVVVQWAQGQAFVGEATGDGSTRGKLRCAAEATARALVQASEGEVDLEVLAVKAVEGFDTVIVVVSLASRVGEVAERLVGSCLIKGQAPRGAVLAVLSATNRLFGHMVHGRPN
jgi:hypothetical protein